jgi:hypothetical protein
VRRRFSSRVGEGALPRSTGEGERGLRRLGVYGGGFRVFVIDSAVYGRPSVFEPGHVLVGRSGELTVALSSCSCSLWVIGRLGVGVDDGCGWAAQNTSGRGSA